METILPRRRLMRIAAGAGAVLALSAPAARAAAKALEPATVPLAQRPAGRLDLVDGIPVLSLGHFDLSEQGYVAEEYFLEGHAAIFAPDGVLGVDGHWTVRAGGTKPYRVRLVVVRPADRGRFSGTAVVEWINVSAGGDAAPGWITMHREAMKAGHAWVAVSAQKVGIDGGNGLNLGVAPLKQASPERYASLDHPGDSFAFDIFAQAGQAVRGNATSLFGGAELKRAIAFGASQSAWFLTTYVNAVAPFDAAFDGYFLQARFSGAAPLRDPNIFGDLALPGTRFRDDLPYPVLVVESETDIVGEGISQGGYAAARQPANDRLRVWEIAGAAHADLSIFAVANADTDSLPAAKRTRLWKPSRDLFGAMIDVPVNSAPQQYYLMNAALRAMASWVAGSKPPTQGAPIRTISSTAGPLIARDARGGAEGGIRSPWTDAPVMIHSGASKLSHSIGRLVGASLPLSAAELAELYPRGEAQYLEAFEASLDEAIASGFLTPEHRPEIMALGAAAWAWAQASDL